jgi:hypothetical protein
MRTLWNLVSGTLWREPCGGNLVTLRFPLERVRECDGIESHDDGGADDRDRHCSVAQRDQLVVRRLVVVHDADGKGNASL